MSTSAWQTNTADLADELRCAGFAIARGFFERPLVSQLTSEADELIARFAVHGHRSEDYWCYDIPGQPLPMLYRIHNLERQGAPLITTMFGEGPLHLLAGAVLGFEAQQTVSAMIVKTPGVAEVPWHRDRVNVPPATAINLSVFLDPSTPENGCLEVVPGSHLLGAGADVDTVRKAGPIALVDAQPGDVVIHDVRLVHGSSGNTSGRVRRSVIIEFEPRGMHSGTGGTDD